MQRNSVKVMIYLVLKGKFKWAIEDFPNEQVIIFGIATRTLRKLPESTVEGKGHHVTTMKLLDCMIQHKLKNSSSPHNVLTLYLYFHAMMHSLALTIIPLFTHALMLVKS